MLFSSKICNGVEQKIHAINRWLCRIGMVALVSMMFIVAADVILRYFLSRPITGSVDIHEVLLAVVAFLSMAYTQNVKGHVQVNIVFSRLGRELQTVLSGITGSLSFLTYAFMAFCLGSKGIPLLFDPSAQRSDTIHIPIAPFRVVAAIGVLMFAIEILIDLIHTLAQARVKEVVEQTYES